MRAELAEARALVHHLLCELDLRVDGTCKLGAETVDLWIVSCRAPASDRNENDADVAQVKNAHPSHAVRVARSLGRAEWRLAAVRVTIQDR